MPKKLRNGEETIKRAGKQLLTDKHSGQFTMTELSEKSRISRMTVYKQIISKEALVRSVVMDDWAEEEERIRKKTDPGSSLEERAQLLYTRLKGYCDQYSASFDDIFAAGGPLRTNEDLAGRLSAITGLTRFVVEVILTFVPLKNVKYEDIEPQIRILVNGDGSQ